MTTQARDRLYPSDRLGGWKANQAPTSSTIADSAFERIVKKLKKLTTKNARSGTIDQLCANWPTIAVMIAAAASSRSTPNMAPHRSHPPLRRARART